MINNSAAKRTPYIVTKQSNGNIVRLTFPNGVHVGTSENPATFTANGAIVASTSKVSVNSSVHLSDVNMIALIEHSAPCMVYLPSNPDEGQLLAVKDASANAGTYNITIVSADYGDANTATIDGSSTLVIDGNSDSYLLGWYDNVWHVISSKQLSAASPPVAGSGGADPGAQYVVMSTTGSLPNERALAVGSGLTLVDAGAGSTVTLDLAPGAASGWQLMNDIDFRALPSATAAGTSISVGSQVWTVDNLSAADSISIVPTVGFVIDPNTSITNYYEGERSAPVAWVPIKDYVTDYDPSTDDIRLVGLLEVTGSNTNYEIAWFGFARLPFVDANHQISIHFMKGYAAGNFTKFSMIKHISVYNGDTQVASASVGVLDLGNNCNAVNTYTGMYSYGTDSFPAFNSLTRAGVTSLARQPGFDTWAYFYYTSQIAIEFTAFPVNSDNSFQATLKRLQIYRLRHG